MKKIAFVAVLAFLALPASAQQTAPQAASQTASQRLGSFYATLESVMKKGPTLGFKGRFNKLSPVVRDIFDLPRMTRRSVGLAWKKQNEVAQQDLVEAFSTFSAATYASRFTKYDGEVFKVLKETPINDTCALVETHLIPEGEAPVTLNYRMCKEDKAPYKIEDVYLDGSISELAMRRADFTAVIKREGFDAVAKMLRAKTSKMAEKK